MRNERILGRKGGKKGGRWGRKGGRDGGREEGRRKEGRKEGREGGRDGGTERERDPVGWYVWTLTSSLTSWAVSSRPLNLFWL